MHVLKMTPEGIYSEN